MRSVIVTGRDQSGFFSHFFSALGACDYCDRHPEYDNVYFDLRVNTYDNLNIWEIVFEQGRVPLEESWNHTSHFVDYCNQLGYFFSESDRVAVHRLIQKYVVIKKEVQREFDELSASLGKEAYIAVHRRATDHFIHGPILGVEDFFRPIDQLRTSLGVPRVYLATDDSESLDRFKERYGSDLLYVPHFLRTSGKTAVHFHPDITDKRRVVKEALFEGLLLAQSAYLVKTYSNLSNFAICMNRNLPYLNVDRHIKYDVRPWLRWPILGLGIWAKLRKLRQFAGTCVGSAK